MALFVFLTESCEADAKKHGLTTEIRRFMERVESTQSTSLFDHFPVPYLVKKKLGGRQGRLIAAQEQVGEHSVIVLLAVMIRSDRVYDDFSTNPRVFGDTHLSALYKRAELEQYLADRTRTEPAPSRQQPNESEYGFLYEAFSHRESSPVEELVCETPEWVEEVSQERVGKQLALLSGPCLEALKKAPGLHFLAIPGKPTWGVWALRTPGRLLLIGVATDSSAGVTEQRARALAAQLEGADATAVLRASRRAYPALVLADDELWIDIEKEPVANMALSPEESEVLESVRKSRNAFPLFINGRAGSGKSTILQYLFADLLYCYLRERPRSGMAPPVYLTASGELLRLARAFVERLLRSEASFELSKEEEPAVEAAEVLDQAFKEFQPFLLSLLPVELRGGRFRPHARVDYSRFRQMWADRFGRDRNALRNFGPDLSWHVIRTYIKGMSSETELEPEDYDQLPENQLTVSPAAYRDVYERVWRNWYQGQLEAHNLWDDQDLTRAVLERDLVKPQFPAIFCDEAQDFTRLELELLLRLNLFSDRSLAPEDARRVPFAFAGDHFQTLNPTGFRWEAIKASFVEKFVFELDHSRRSGSMELNYRELEFNYRSTRSIVRFGNHVQAMRAALFRLPEVKPQTPWSTGQHSFPVTWFRARDAAFWKKFRENSGLVIIVPCNEGEESDFVRNDPILNEHVGFDEGVPVNVLSAGRAKGCEYPAVVVYGFGAASPVDFAAELRESESEALSSRDFALPLQYFINRLYVAVSRPKRRLLVVDTDEGLEKLWFWAREEGAEEELLARIKNGRETWSSLVEGMTVGDPEDLTKEIAGDPRENAAAFEKDGLARRDSFLLLQAAAAYRSGGDMAKARECRARALEMQGSLLEAGEAYFHAGFAVPDGVRCLWGAGRAGWERLAGRLSSSPEIERETEFQWAKAIVAPSDGRAAVELLELLGGRLERDELFRAACARDSSWDDAVGALLKQLLKSDEQREAGEGFWQRVLEGVERVRAHGITVQAAGIAEIHFRAKRYREAIGWWDKAGATRHAEYLRAKAECEPYPERLTALAALGASGEVVDSYLAAPAVELSTDQAGVVVEALADAGRNDEALRLAWHMESPALMFRLAVRVFRAGTNPEAAAHALHGGMVLLERKGEWEAIARFAQSREIPAGSEWRQKDLRDWVASESVKVMASLMRALARSEALPRAPRDARKRLAEAVRRFVSLPSRDWIGRLSALEAGAALERTGRYTEASSFYEGVFGGAFEETIKRSARERWLVCKLRQKEHEEQHGTPARVKDTEREIRQFLGTWKIASGEGYPQYPELPPLIGSLAPKLEGAHEPEPPAPEDETAEVAQRPYDGADPVEVVVGRFKLAFSRRNSRCNITEVDSLATGFVKISERKCGGEVACESLSKDSWVFSPWNLHVTLSGAEEVLLTLHFADLGFSCVFHGE